MRRYTHILFTFSNPGVFSITFLLSVSIMDSELPQRRLRKLISSASLFFVPYSFFSCSIVRISFLLPLNVPPLAQASRLCLQSTTSETKKPPTSVESSVKVRLSRRKFHVDQGKWYEHSSTTWIISSASSANDTEEGQFLISCSVVLLFNSSIVLNPGLCDRTSLWGFKMQPASPRRVKQALIETKHSLLPDIQLR